MVQAIDRDDAQTTRGYSCCCDGGGGMSSPSHIDSYEQFYLRESQSIVRFARSKVDDQQTAEDLAAEALTITYSRWDQLMPWLDERDGPSRVRNYALGVVKNLARELYRKSQRHTQVIGGHVVESDASIADPTSSRVEVRHAFEQALGRLSRKQSRVLLMNVCGYSTAEIADSLDVMESTARGHLASARRLVQQLLEHLRN
jgi:RNA polymerase sigma factor (sigma-70 family)